MSRPDLAIDKLEEEKDRFFEQEYHNIDDNTLRNTFKDKVDRNNFVVHNTAAKKPKTNFASALK